MTPHPTALPPLSLYLHFPWCVRKCPYCDFNSHMAGDGVPEKAYIDALLADLQHDLPRVAGRGIVSLFLGGGTPSLFRPEALGRLFDGLRRRLTFAADAEITLEANPGAVEHGRFEEYRAVGINRLSLGVQSLDDAQLAAIGRIHSAAEARRAAEAARAAGFDNLNLDLMFGLPGQEPAGAMGDLRGALELEPSHLSWYQLTLEPNTAFHHAPPPLPDDELLWATQEEGQALLAGHGLEQYEISAYARGGRRCRHNLNYWTFGDYLGLGAGAHGKLSGPDGIRRRWRRRHPRDYLEHANRPEAIAGESLLAAADLPLEFAMNALRLTAGVPAELFQARTGLAPEAAAAALHEGRRLGLLTTEEERWRPTLLGRLHLNTLLGLFLPDS